MKETRITPTAIDSYIEKFHPHFSRETVEKRMELAARHPIGSRSFKDGRSYAPAKIGNGHDGICYLVLEQGEVVDVMTKGEYSQAVRCYRS